MIITFWVSAIVCTVIALAFILPPFLRKNKIDDTQHQQMNVAIYQERLQELKNAHLTESAFAQAQQELDKNLVDDLGENNTNNRHLHHRWPVFLLAILIPASALGGYYFSMNPQAFDPQAKKARSTRPAMSMEAMIVKLEQKVAENPTDKEGVLMLGRSYQSIGEYGKATILYEKAMSTDMAKDADVVINYAEILALSAQRNLAGKPAELIAKALVIDPKHIKGLWLAGMLAIQEKHPEQALAHWKKLLQQVPENSENWKSVNEQIQEIQAMLNKPVTPTATTDSAKAAPSPASTETADVPQLSVKVDIRAELKQKLPPTASVLIYARSATGPKMPLAMAKKTVADLPITVTLDDSMAMIPNMKLSNFPQVVVIAKASHQASAKLSTGDLWGESRVIDLAKAPAVVVVDINQVAP